MILSNSDIYLRKPVWSALSMLWLDTELQESEINSIAEIMFKSGYSIKQLHHIYQKEVAPIVYTNLLCPAGEWAGFDEAWLHEKIISSLRSRNCLDYLFFKLNRKLMFYATDELWKKIELRFNQKKRHNTFDR